jgi:hypothetical protein
MDRMRDEQHDNATGHPKGLPPQLTTLDPVLFDQGKWVCEDQHGILKANAMFSFVAVGLGLVPFEPNHCRPIIATDT